jgi:two-component system response regulator HydG
MKAYLSMKHGARAGANYLLEPGIENHIGRGLDCHIVLTDPLSSRVHAIIRHDEDGWWIRDAGSRNGTFLDGQKIDDVRLFDNATIRIGHEEVVFHDGEPLEAFTDTVNPALMQTIVLDAPVDPNDTGNFVRSALLDEEHATVLLDLYQLSITLLGYQEPDRVVRETLDVLKQKLRASVIGFLWVSDDGALKPKIVLPENAANKVTLSSTLTQFVLTKRHAIWVNSHPPEGASDSVKDFADAICVPLISQRQTLGAIHVYLEQGRFRQSDFEFALSVGHLLSVALDNTRRIASLQVQHERLVQQSGSFDELIGESRTMRELKNRIVRVAKASGCVLVRGESGCGKELVARAIHRASPRADRPLLSVNCAAIPRDLMESQLFGHRKGAFTGADSDHSGWFQQADTGTLFLDEVGELTAEGQAKLLRVLEGHPFLPVGAQREIQVDVRLIAATNRDLREFVQDGRFREDLYYRLMVFELYIPPLRERGEDVPRLVDYFFSHFRRQHGRPNLKFSAESLTKLHAYQWPGNVRQLRNVIDSAVVMAEGDEILPEDLGLRDVVSGGLESLRIDYWERKLIQEALKRTEGNIPAAAVLLGIGRATLYRKVDEYSLK